MENQTDPIMEYGDKFRRVMATKDLKDNYTRWQNMIREEQRRIKDSSEARKYILKNLDAEDPIKLLSVACRCIYDLTGDLTFRKVIERLEEMEGEIYEKVGEAYG